MMNDISQRVYVPPNTPQIQNHELPVAQENPLHLNGNDENGGTQEIH